MLLCISSLSGTLLFLSVQCSRILCFRILSVSPIYDSEQSHTNLYITSCFSIVLVADLRSGLKTEKSFLLVYMIFNWMSLKLFLITYLSFLTILSILGEEYGIFRFHFVLSSFCSVGNFG